jgi:hypothetical protein
MVANAGREEIRDVLVSGAVVGVAIATSQHRLAFAQ